MNVEVVFSAQVIRSELSKMDLVKAIEAKAQSLESSENGMQNIHDLVRVI
jgi:hypothetical protein